MTSFQTGLQVIRAGDDSTVPPVTLLRSLFVPTSRAQLIPHIVSWIKDQRIGIGEGRITFICFNCFLRNSGLVSAEGSLVTLHGKYSGEFETPQGWRKHDTAMSPISFESPRAVFPGETMQIFRYRHDIPIRRTGEANYVFPSNYAQHFELRVFSHNQTPIKALVAFTEDDVVHNVKKPCSIEEIRG